MVIAHQLESVNIRVFIDIPKDITIFQPRIDDAKPGKFGQLLRDSKERKYVWMRDVLPSYNLAVETLV